MLSPKRTKFRKYHRGKMRGRVFDKVSFGEYACVKYTLLES